MILSIVILIILILINGIFSCSEIAFLSLNKYELQTKVKENNNKAIKINNLLKDSSTFLATIQVVITFAGFLASAFASETFAERIMLIIDVNPIYKPGIEMLLMVIITIIISYFTLIFGELLPKKIGLANPNKIAYKSAGILEISFIIFKPFVVILTKSVNFFSKILNIKDKGEEKLTEGKIKKIIALGKNEGILEVEETEILMNVFKFNDITAKNVMTPKKDIVFIEFKKEKKEIIKEIKNKKLTRFPVLKDKKIIGILNVKDLIINYNNEIETLLRKPIYVNEEDKIDDIFRLMNEKNQILMIVGNENNIKGIITMEDIIEELLGNICDEFN